MPFKPNTCYSLLYEDGSSLTFKIEGAMPEALHLVMVNDCDTGVRYRLFELLMRPWKDLKRIDCIDEC